MVRKARAEFEITAESKVGRAMREVRSELDGIGKTAQSVTRLAAGAFAGLISADVVRRTATLADEYNTLTQRVRTATKETGDFDRVMQGLLASAARTGSEFSATIDVFQAISRIRDDIGITNEQAIIFGRTVQQLGVIGGATSEGMANGLRQLSQSLAGGIVRAEEFNSLVENTPEIVARIAQGLGVTQGELRQLVLDGRLLADDVMQIILSQAEGIDAEFEQMPATLARASETFATALGNSLSQIDQRLGATTALANLINEVSFQLSPETDPEREKNELLERQSKLLEQISMKRGEGNAVQEAFLTGIGEAMAGQSVILGIAIDRLSGGATANLRELQDELANVDARLMDIDDATSKPLGGGGAGSAAGEDAGVEQISQKEINERAAAERRLMATQDFFARTSQLRFDAEENEIAAEEVRFQRQLAGLEKQRSALEQHGQITAEIEAGFAQARLDIEAQHDARIQELELRKIERAELQAERDAEQVERTREMLAGIFETRLEAEDRDIEIEEMRYERQIADLERQRELLLEHGLLTAEIQQEFRDAEVDAEATKAERIASLQAKSEKRKLDESTKGLSKFQKLAQGVLGWEKASWSDRTTFALGTAAELTAGLAQESKAAFAINQAAALAGAIVHTSRAVTEALPNFPLAAAVGAAGALQIASIAATAFGGGGSRGGGTLSGVPSQASSIEQTTSQQSIPEILERDQSVGTRTLRIEFGGGDGEIAQALTNQLRIKLDEEDAVLFGPNSRQALELRA